MFSSILSETLEVVYGANQCFQIPFHKPLAWFMRLINVPKYSLRNRCSHFDSTNEENYIPSDIPFVRVYESATYNNPFLGLLKA